MKTEVVVLLLFLMIISIGSVDFLAFVSPCDSMSELECIGSYNGGYISTSTCNTMFYCYPRYVSGIFDDCVFVPRTNFSSCDNMNSCYNGIVMDLTQSRKCFCDLGVEYKTIDPCGNSGNWSGMCLDINSCKGSERLYLRRTVTDYNCNILSDQKDIDCFSLTYEDIRCISGKKLVKSRYYYVSNVCGTACVLDNIEILSEKNCDCIDDKCLPVKKTIVIEKEKEVASLPNVIEKDNDSKNISITSVDIPEENISNSEKENVISTDKKLDLKIKIKKDIPMNLLTIMLVFVILFISGMLFLLHNR